MVKKIIVFIFIFLIGMPIKIEAATYLTSRDLLRYEIRELYFTDRELIIKGWGVLKSAQQFYDSNTHAYGLEVIGDSATTYYWSAPEAKDLTSMFFYNGVGYCSSHRTWTESNVCNYYYQNVGFTFRIPLSELKKNQTYWFNLMIQGNIIEQTYKIPIYYPMKLPMDYIKGRTLYRTISNLDDSSLRIMNSQVFVRDSQYLDKNRTYNYGPSCSTTYGNILYYKQDAYFYTIYEKGDAQDVSYYRLSGQLSNCVNNRREVIEGTQLHNMWISSLYVDYIGRPLSITNHWMGTPPKIIIKEHPTLYVNELFILEKYANAYDQEDGDLSHQLKIISSNLKNEPGKYEVKLQVVDSDNEMVEETLYVQVVNYPNTPPVIIANDLTINQYAIFDYYDGVSAHDKEDGVITRYIRFKGEVNTKIIGDYFVDCQVCDAQDACTQKMRKITVIPLEEKKTRFISITRPFYHEEVPLNWKERLGRMYNELQNNQSYYSFELE